MAQVTQPFNYLKMVQNPAQEAIQAFQGAYQARQQQQQSEMFRSAFNEFARKPNKGVSDYVQLLQVTPPEMVNTVKASFEAMTEEQQNVAKRDMGQLITAFRTNPQEGIRLLDTRIAAARNAGDMQEVDSLKRLKGLAEISPESIVETLAFEGGIAFGEDFLGKIVAGPGETQSVRHFGNGVMVFATRDLGRVVLDKFGKQVEGEEAARVIQEALDAEAAQKEQVSQAAAVGRLSASEASELLNLARNATSTINNLNEALRLVEEEGANTGYIESKLPTWRASSIALDNVQKQLGLDVIGRVTFGALSEGELDLALATALPTNLQEEELAKWIRDKIVAQQKLRNEYAKAAAFLAGGGTIYQYVTENATGIYGDPISSEQRDMKADDILAKYREEGLL